jgi:hypothetical protein
MTHSIRFRVVVDGLMTKKSIGALSAEAMMPGMLGAGLYMMAIRVQVPQKGGAYFCMARLKLGAGVSNSSGNWEFHEWQTPPGYSWAVCGGLIGLYFLNPSGG